MTRSRAKQALLELQKATDVVSPTGAVSRTWATIGAVFADIKAAGGSQTYAADQVQTGQDLDVVIRWRHDVNAADYRLVYTNLWPSPPVATVFDIVSIGDKAGDRRELTARCKVRTAEGLRGESA